jgi:hypothetical protein
MQVNSFPTGTYERFSGVTLEKVRKQPFLDVSRCNIRDFTACEGPWSVRKGKGEGWEKGKETVRSLCDGAAVALPPRCGEARDGSTTAIPTMVPSVSLIS